MPSSISVSTITSATRRWGATGCEIGVTDSTGRNGMAICRPLPQQPPSDNGREVSRGYIVSKSGLFPISPDLGKRQPNHAENCAPSSVEQTIKGMGEQGL